MSTRRRVPPMAALQVVEWVRVFMTGRRIRLFSVNTRGVRTAISANSWSRSLQQISRWPATYLVERRVHGVYTDIVYILLVH